MVILLNKWDLITTEEQRKDVAQSLAQRMVFAPWAPTINVSALTGRAVDKVLEAAVRVAENHAQQIPTPKLNHCSPSCGSRAIPSRTRVVRLR
jgi:GTP-binding protein